MAPNGCDLERKAFADGMAEGEGFEPPLPFRVKRFSRPPVSIAQTSLRESSSNGPMIRWQPIAISQRLKAIESGA